jgi:ABC-2 type transport system permease protein
MSFHRILALSRHNLRLTIHDPAPLIVYLLMPLIMMAFLRPTFRLVLLASGQSGSNGAEMAVPGMTGMFAFFWVSIVGFNMFREHGWGTWSRLQVSMASMGDIILGKVLPMWLVVSLQLGGLFFISTVVFDLHIHGSIMIVAAIIIVLSLCLVMLAVALVALCHTMDQMIVLANLGALLCGGLGGAIAPVKTLPSWAQTLAHGIPTYWAIRGLQDAIQSTGKTMDGWQCVGILLLFALMFAAIARIRFRFSEAKIADT